ncbi:MAG: phosphate acyltransferase PlsX [Candidatus Saccharicenans sp.]|nr:phosphate acyltransferase PlsX [Candidatus Saccharicenans sp.]
MMKVAVDAMGGDYAPREIVAGSVAAAEELGVEVLLVGPEPVLRQELDRFRLRSRRITVVDAPELVAMDEDLLSIRHKRQSSIIAGTQLLKRGQAEAFISMGNTAAVTFISRKVLGSLEGIDKPALALLVPTQKGVSLLIDVGASANCQPYHLVQFALMGSVFMETALGRPNPTVALISIGEERNKGNTLIINAHQELQRSPLNFIGNVEGKDLFRGVADVIVSDGFTGNVTLKVSEGVIETIAAMAKKEIGGNLLARIGFLFLRKQLKKIYKKVDYSEYGGAHLLGVKGICIIGHGRSDRKAVKNAIRLGQKIAAEKIQEKIQDKMQKFVQACEGVKG